MATDRTIDYSRIRASVDRMIEANEPPEFIDGFLESEGATLEGLKSYSQAPQPAVAAPPLTQEPGGTSAGPIDDAEPDRLARLQEKLGARAEEGRQIEAAEARGEIGPIRSGFQQAGIVGMGSAFDIGGELIGAGGEAIKGAQDRIAALYASQRTGRPYGEQLAAAQEAQGPVSRGIEAVAQTAPAQAVGKGLGKAVEFGQEKMAQLEEYDPNIARDVRSGALMAFGGPAGLAKKQIAAGPTALGRGADIAKMGVKRDKKLADMVRSTAPASKVAAARKGKKETLTGFEVVDEGYQKKMASDVADIPGANPREGHQKLINRINDEVNQKKAALNSSIEDLAETVPINDFNLATQKVINDIVGDPKNIKGGRSIERTTTDLMERYVGIAEKYPKTAQGLNQMRQEFDDAFKTDYPTFWKKMQKPGYKPSNTTEKTYVALRDSTNKMFETLAPGARAENQRISRLIRAGDNLAPKAAKEYESVVAKFKDWANRKSSQGILAPATIGFDIAKTSAAGIANMGRAGAEAILRSSEVALNRADRAIIVAYIESLGEQDEQE